MRRGSRKRRLLLGLLLPAVLAGAAWGQPEKISSGPQKITGDGSVTLERSLTAASGEIAAGAIEANALATPGAPTVTPTGGAATAWGYKIVALLHDGTYGTAAGAEGTTAVGAATLDGTHYNTLTWTAVTSAWAYDVYRTTSGGTPATTGKIGRAYAATLVDNGLAGDSAPAPTAATTGTVKAARVVDSGLTAGRVVVSTTSGELADQAGLTASGGAITAANVTDSGLTSGRVVLGGTAGLLEDDAGLTYAGTGATLAATLGTDVELSRSTAGVLDIGSGTGGAIRVDAAGKISGVAVGSSTSTKRARATNVATLTTGAAHNLLAGQVVTVSGVTDAVAGTYSGTYTVASTPTTTSLTYADAGADEVETADVGGTIAAQAVVQAGSQLRWPESLGAITHIMGPKDQALAIAAQAPAQATGATAGKDAMLTASAATAGHTTTDAAAGGSVTVTAGAAARNTAGNAAGGSINLNPGAGIGTGAAGNVNVATASVFNSAVAADNTTNLLRVTGTMSASPSVAVDGVKINVTSADTVGKYESALRVTLSPGKVAASASAAVSAENNVTVTGSGWNSAYGVDGRSLTGNWCNVGVQGYASATGGGTYAYGVYGVASNAAFVRGVAGMGGAAGIGGLFGLSNAAFNTGDTTALKADNGTVAAPIFLAADNGTKVFGIEDGGYLTSATLGVAGTVTWGLPAASPQAYTHALSASARGGTDTNTAGVTSTVQGSLGTGIGASGSLVFKAGTPQATGTTQHVAATILTLTDVGTSGTSSPLATFSGAVTVGTGASGTNSPAITLLADNGGTDQSATIQVINAVDPYLRVSAPNNAGAATAVFDVHDTSLVFVSDGTVDIGATGANRPSNLHLSGYVQSSVRVVANTGDATPAASDSLTVYTNEGDGDGSSVTLPAAAAGLQFTACVQAAQTLTLTAGSGDTIRSGASVTAAAGSITNATVGACGTFTAINATEWFQTAGSGAAWAF